HRMSFMVPTYWLTLLQRSGPEPAVLSGRALRSPHMSPDAETVRVEVDVEDCGIVGLFDGGCDDGGDPGQSVALVKGWKAMADLVVAHQHANGLPFTVTVADHDPGADLDGYEEIVEIDFTSPTGEVHLIGWRMDWDDAAVRRLPRLPAGPGVYR